MSGTQNVQQPGRRFQGDPLLSDQDIQDGRAYLFRWYPTLVLAIEAAARADALAELRRGVEGLGSPVGSGVFAIYRQGWADACLAVLALLPDPPK